MAKRTLEITLVGDSKQLDRAMKNADRSLGRLSGSAYRANQGLGGLVQQMGGSQRSAVAANAAFEKQKQSLGELGRFAKRATLITGGLAAAGIAYGMKLNAQWETNEKSFGTLLGSMEKGKKLMEDLRQVSSKSYLRLTDFQEASKLMLGMGVSAKQIVPIMSSVNAAVSAVGGNRETLNRVTLALGQMQAKGKASAEEMRQLAEAGLPINKILQKELHLSAEQVANIGNEGVKSGAVLKAVSEAWQRKYGPGLNESMKTGTAQFEMLKKNAEGFLRVATHGIYEQLAKKVLPAANAELQKFTDIMNDDRLTGSQKIARMEVQFNRLIDSVGVFAQKVAPKIGQAIDRFAPMFGRLVSKLTPLFADTAAKMISVMAPVLAKGAATVAGAFVKGFVNSDTWGRLLIGGWLFTKMGGFAAMRAAGTTAGTTVATSTAGGMAAGGSKIGAAAAGWKGSIISGLQSAGIGLAVAGTIWAGMDAYKALKPVSGSMSEQLDQIAGKADTVQAKMGGLFSKMPKVGFGSELANMSRAFGFDRLGTAGADANRLKVILSEINTVGTTRYGQLVREGRQIAANLGLTKEAKRELESSLMGRGDAMSAGQAGIDNLASGMITRFRDIRRLTADNAALIARAWGRGTPEWRSATARNMNAAVAAIRAGMRQGVIAAGKGKERIRELLRRRDLVTGQNVGGIARGFKSTWLNAGKISNAGIKNMIQDLRKMPPEAREQARQMMMRMARQLQSSGQLPKGSMSKLRSALVTEFGRAGTATKKTSDRINGNLRRITDAQGKVVRSTQDFRRRFGSALTPLPSVTQNATAGVVSSFNSAKSAIQGQGAPQAKRKGGLIQRFARGGEVAPVMVSPGEAIVHRGRTSMVPGRPEPRDSVFTYAPVGSTVLTFDGQRRMAEGASLSQARARQAPHFAGGGLVKKPVITGSTPRGRETGNLAISGVYSAAQAKLKKLRENAFNVGGPAGTFDGRLVAGWILPILKWARAHGWAGHITSGYRSPAHNATIPGASPTSNHLSMTYPGGAIDVGGYEARAEGAALAGVLARYPRKPNLVWGGPTMNDWGHFSATGHRKGGVIQRFRGGGGVKGLWRGSRYDRRYPKSDGYHGARLPAKIIMAIAESFGLPGRTMYNITRGESMGRPGTDISDPPGRSRGLYAVNDHFNPQYDKNELRNPIYATWAASKLAGAAGGPNPNIWHGNQYVNGWDEHMDASQLKLRKIIWAAGGDPEGQRAYKRAKRQVRGSKRMWRRIGKLGTTKTGRKQAKRAASLAHRAVKAAKSFKPGKSRSLSARARKARMAAYRSVAEHQRRKAAVRGGGSGGAGSGGDGGVSGPSGPGLGPKGTLFRTLPQAIRDQLAPLLAIPGQSWQQKRDILDNAFGIAETTPGIDDDRQVQNLIIGMERRRRKRAAGVLRGTTGRLKGMNPGLWKKKIGRIDKLLKGKGLSKGRRASLLKQRAGYQKKLSAYNRLTGRRDSALATVNAADEAIRSARDKIRNLGGEDGSSSDLAEEIKALREEIAKQTAAMKRGADVDNISLRRALTDLLSGDLAGRADPVRGYGFQPAVNF